MDATHTNRHQPRIVVSEHVARTPLWLPDRMAHYTLKKWNMDPNDLSKRDANGINALYCAGEWRVGAACGYMHVGAWAFFEIGREPKDRGRSAAQ